MELLLGFVLICLGLLGFGNGQNVIDVTKFGAVGDGKTDDSKAFLKAWGEACGGSDSQTMRIPNGKSFLLQPVAFEGPCKSSIHVEGTLVGPDPNEWADSQRDKWIIFRGVNDLLFDGSGKIDGRGEPWWKATKPQNDKNRPTALEFIGSDNLKVKGITSINSPRNHIGISGCNGATVSNVNLIAPAESPNTDGINIATSNQVNILDSFIGTGDDCVAMNGGNIGITIRNVNCGPGHGLSIGSLGRGGQEESVENIRVEKCTFNRTDNGARIKTVPGGSGHAKDISFQNITLIEVKNPIIIDQFYGKCNHEICPEENSAIQVSDVKFIGFKGTTTSEEAIQLNCSTLKGCKDIVMEDVDIKSPEGKKVKATTHNAQVISRKTSPSVESFS